MSFLFGPRSFFRLLSVASDYRDGREKSFRANRVESREYAREKFAIMVVTGFPAETAGEVAERAARFLGVSKRQVENWLRGDSSPAFEHVVVVGTTIGIWKTMEIMTGGKTREQVMEQIGQ